MYKSIQGVKGAEKKKGLKTHLNDKKTTLIIILILIMLIKPLNITQNITHLVIHYTVLLLELCVPMYMRSTRYCHDRE